MKPRVLSHDYIPTKIYCKQTSTKHTKAHTPPVNPNKTTTNTMTEYTYKMAYKFDAVEEGELTCRKDQLVTSDSKFICLPSISPNSFLTLPPLVYPHRPHVHSSPCALFCALQPTPTAATTGGISWWTSLTPRNRVLSQKII